MMELSRPLFDLGLLTRQELPQLDFWRDHIGLRVVQELSPVKGVRQYKLDLQGAVLKLNCVDMELPAGNPLSGIRTLLIADESVSAPSHLRDPDGNLVCLVPSGFQGVDSFGVHLAVADEAAFHHFYGKVLQLVQKGERAYDLGGATVSFAWSPDVEPQADTTGVGYNYLTIQVMDTEATHRALLDRGAIEESAPGATHTTTDSIISFIKDPDGNRIEISQRPELVAKAQ